MPDFTKAEQLSTERRRSGNGPSLLAGQPSLGSYASLDLGPFSDEFASFGSSQDLKKKKASQQTKSTRTKNSMPSHCKSGGGSLFVYIVK